MTDTTDLPACASQDGAHPPIALTADAGAQTGRPVATVIAADWPCMSMLPGSSVLYSLPGTADLIVDGRTVTVALCLDHGDTDRPYVSDYPESMDLAQCDTIDAAIGAAWDAQCGREAA